MTLCVTLRALFNNAVAVLGRRLFLCFLVTTFRFEGTAWMVEATGGDVYDKAVPMIHILYTGGTIGMQPSADGLVPASGFAALAHTAQAQRSDSDRLPDWQLKELVPLIDSANMTQHQWQRLAQECREAQQQGAAGIVILHGTDTLAYTAGALAFLLATLKIPVVITGAMLPAGAPRSDAWENFFGALAAVEQMAEPAVEVFFHGRRMPGWNCCKVKSAGRHAFLPAREEAVSRRGRDLPELPDAGSTPQVATLTLFPGIQVACVEPLLNTVDGLVIECYGSGTAPSEDEALMAAFERAAERGALLLAISQCAQGNVVLDTYAAGSRLVRAGVIGAGRMTREAALGKLYWCCGIDCSVEERRYWLEQNVLGERGSA
ncbi:asparaginase [Carnimonas nigrificans]|uniref:asparaginase n=1 Tax=Carnimonas nigrificans TaxID=64323 RepID=UPI001B7FA47A|nr:asparaginase [Carnimonas nigrificans]